MSLPVLLPAAPGFFAQYPSGGLHHIVAWEITRNPVTLDLDVSAVTIEGYAGDDVIIVCPDEPAARGGR